MAQPFMIGPIFQVTVADKCAPVWREPQVQVLPLEQPVHEGEYLHYQLILPQVISLLVDDLKAALLESCSNTAPCDVTTPFNGLWTSSHTQVQHNTCNQA